MDTGDVVASIIATVSLIATAILAYRQTRLQGQADRDRTDTTTP